MKKEIKKILLQDDGELVSKLGRALMLYQEKRKIEEELFHLKSDLSEAETDGEERTFLIGKVLDYLNGKEIKEIIQEEDNPDWLKLLLGGRGTLIKSSKILRLYYEKDKDEKKIEKYERYKKYLEQTISDTENPFIKEFLTQLRTIVK